jgi:thiamine biosynthesis lipoprotein
LRWLFFAVAALLLLGCAGEEPVLRLEGPTMGTRWHITLHPTPTDAQNLQPAIESLLQTINQSMSTYIPDSEISRFNALPAGESMQVSVEFAEVLDAALQIGTLSEGAYDVSVGPLVELWGFGAGDSPLQAPAAEQIDALRASVGQQQLGWDRATSTLSKPVAMRLDFSSIAKGYAVDRLAALLDARGVRNYLVEIGGEIRVAGKSPRGDHWRVAVEQPRLDRRDVAMGLSLSGGAVATSGDYRNFLLLDGERYAHIIDPRTGRPVTHELVSVTVLHPQCMYADALATALTVLGREAALALAERESLPVYLISREGDELVRHASPAFAPYLDDEDAASSVRPPKP